MHRFRWDDLQYVMAVATAGSLSGAARALGVNHATVLRRISAFEESLGVRLFERPPGGYRLRAEAREALAAIRSMAETVDRLERVMPAIGRGFEGSFRLTSTDTIATLILPRRLRAIRALHPQLTIDVVAANAALNLERSEAEITVRPAQALPDGLSGRLVGRMTFRIFGAAGYLARNPSDRVEDHSWLGVGAPLTRSPVGAWQQATLGDRVDLRADSFLTLARMAEAGMGLAMLPAFVGRASPDLRPAAQFADLRETSIWVAAHADIAGAGRTRWLIDLLADALAEDLPAFEDAAAAAP